MGVAVGGGGGGDDVATDGESEPQPVVDEPADMTSSTSTTTTTTDPPQTTGPATSSTSSASTTTSEPPPAAQEDGCGYLGVDSFDDIQVDLRITSPLSSVDDLIVTYGLKDETGVRFVTSDAFIESVYPNEVLRIQADTLEELPSGVTNEDAITCEILGTETFGFGDPPVLPAEGSACEYVGLDFADDIQVEITVSNSFDDTGDLIIDHAPRGPGGVRFDTAFAFIELVAANDTVRTAEDSLADVPAWLSPTDEITCDVLSVELRTSDEVVEGVRGGGSW